MKLWMIRPYFKNLEEILTLNTWMEKLRLDCPFSSSFPLGLSLSHDSLFSLSFLDFSFPFVESNEVKASSLSIYII
ncbi:hypothetical protein LOK49_LG15G00443 [Camellia lanceoleosa]|uniref:Uncharacterized protein n=1 Tax=Camellia lanceoleosa TaxID=1840588 RepID=A0ACC0F667_9ERIC|nr:hypothetical protein LOK49_LG15G00443 [Camellia lanceoleosa]